MIHTSIQDTNVWLHVHEYIILSGTHIHSLAPHMIGDNVFDVAFLLSSIQLPKVIN